MCWTALLYMLYKMSKQVVMRKSKLGHVLNLLLRCVVIYMNHLSSNIIMWHSKGIVQPKMKTTDFQKMGGNSEWIIHLI